MTADLKGKVALVAGATRGAGRGIAVELGASGATVYVTGRTTREKQSEYGRPETIEETAELVTAAGGRGIAVPESPKKLAPTETEPRSSASSTGSSTSSARRRGTAARAARRLGARSRAVRSSPSSSSSNTSRSCDRRRKRATAS